MTSSPVHKAPALLACIPFAAGVILYQHLSPDVETLLFFAGVSMVLLFILQFQNTKGRSLLNSLHLLLYLFLFLSLGMLRFVQEDKINDFDGSIKSEFIATVCSTPMEKENSYRVELQLDSTNINAIQTPLNTKIISYIEKSEEVSQLLPGERIAFSTLLEAPGQALNPGGFDYKKYLQRKEVFATAYLSSENWIKIEGESYNIRIAAARVQNYVVQLLGNQNYQQEELALIAALTVGYKQMIGHEQRAAYVSSGATHVLAVSGLHTGILFLFLMRIFKPLGSSKRMLVIRSLLTVLLLWCFAFITGLSPSVTRATLMFSLVSLGHISKQKSNIYNTIFLSAFILLFINPRLIYDLGFQLSYSAVLGIVSLQPHFSKLFIQRLHLHKKIADLIAVSIAAQIGTAPISIHVFHCFPSYFILTNVWIIPLVGLIVNGAILLILVSLSGLPSGFISIPLGWALKIMNEGVEFISQLPQALNTSLYIDNWTILLIYTALILLTFALYRHSKRYLTSSMILVVIILIYNFHAIESNKDTCLFFAFSDRNTFNIAAQQGLRSDIIYEKDKPFQLPDYFTQHYLGKNTLNAAYLGENYSNNNLKIYQDFILTPQGLYALYSPELEGKSGQVEVDALFMNNYEPGNIYKLYEHIKFKILVLHHRPEKHLNYYKSFCEKKGIQLHLTYEDGAFIAEL